MKRKLVDYEVFNKMKENSLTTAVKELVEAEEHLARALNVDGLELSSFDESTVIYEQADGTYLKANYSFSDDGRISFEDIEQLVINEESERQESRKAAHGLLEAILDDNQVEADKFFNKYLDIENHRYKRESATVSEGYARAYFSKERTKGKGPKISYRPGAKDPKKAAAAKEAHRRHRTSYLAGARKRDRSKENREKYKSVHTKLRALNAGKHYAGKRKMAEWRTLAENVFGFIDFSENGHVLNETVVASDKVVLPDSKMRAEGKILKMHFDNMLKTDLKVLREAARRLVQDHAFCSMIADVKRYNNISDNKELEESIGTLVKSYPSVLYLTQEELAHIVSNALDTVGVTNYDDQTCHFMAEGILRVAHDAYSDRVERILKLANKDLQESDDKYLDFQKAISSFFPVLDESFHLEMKMFEDLYNATVEVRKIAVDSQNDVIRNEAQGFISELEDILNGRMIPNLEVAADIANWLETIVEANVPGAGEMMDVVKKPYVTVSGDHPQMAKNAKQPGNPGSYTGDWGDSAPMIGSDSNAWNHGDEARNRSWANQGGKNVWPDLENPIAKPTQASDRTIKGEKWVGDEEGFGNYQSADTWGPGEDSLHNPYVPKSALNIQQVQPDNGVV